VCHENGVLATADICVSVQELVYKLIRKDVSHKSPLVAFLPHAVFGRYECRVWIIVGGLIF
jgi:hypothetical protein